MVTSTAGYRSDGNLSDVDSFAVTVAPENPWRPLLHDRLRGHAHPLLVMPDTLWSAASLWAGSRAWTRALRAAGVVAGDRVVCALPAGPAFVQVLVACLWEGIAFVPVPSDAALSEVIEQVMPVLCVTASPIMHGHCACWMPDAAGQPPEAPAVVSRAVTAAADAPCLLFSVPDANGSARWIPLSTESALALLASHRPLLDLSGAVVLSVVPWDRPFGLIPGLLASLLDASEIVVAPTAPGDADVVCALVREHPVTRVVLLHELLEEWGTHAGLRALLASIGGVLVGRAPAAGPVERIEGSSLRWLALGPPFE